MDPSTLSSGIKTTSGLDLFSSIVAELDSPSLTYIQGLDGLLESTRRIQRGDVVEVQGLTGSGKTLLLLHLSMISILQVSIYHAPSGKTVHIGGKQLDVCFVDCTQRFPLTRLVDSLRRHLRDRIRIVENPPRETFLDQLVQECLQRFVLFRPDSLLQLAATIKSIPTLYAGPPSSFQPTGERESLGHVMIDGMSEFGWSSQYDLEHLSPMSPISSSLALSHLISSIALLRQSLAPTIYITQWVFNPSLVPSYSKDRYPFYKGHLEPPWPRPTPPRGVDHTLLEPFRQPVHTDRPSFPIHHHITCHPPVKPRMAKGVSMAEAWEGRKGARGEGTDGFVCVIRIGGKEIGAWEWSVREDKIDC